MEDMVIGAHGQNVLSLAEQGVKHIREHVPIPHHNMEVPIVLDLEHLKRREAAPRIHVQSMVGILIGPAFPHVTVMAKSYGEEPALTRDQNMVVEIVHTWEMTKIQAHVHFHVGQLAPLAVMKELNTQTAKISKNRQVNATQKARWQDL